MVCTKYGPPEVFQLREVPKPSPGNHEVLIKIRATSVTASDCIVRGLKIPIWRPMGFAMRLMIGFGKPRNPILGMVFAGDIEAVGRYAKRFKPGDAVLGWTIKSGLRFGTYAEYKCLPDDSLMVVKPSNVSYEEAAALPYGGLLALSYLKEGHIHSGQKILIYGASGAIGTAAVQLAKHFGADVTGVCSTANLDLVTSLGADHVLDYTKQDAVSGTYDFILDAVGKRKSSTFKTLCQQALAPNGKYISVDDGSPTMQMDHLVLLRDLLAAGTIRVVIDRCYPLEDMVEAHRHVDTGHKKGNVVISVEQNA
jgi:NADPH:quinone reductase-like Zn-dependent oxidoreductase